MIDVKHVCREGQKFNKAPTNFTFNPVTPFIPLKDIINQIQEKKAAEETWVMTNKQEYEKKDRIIEAQNQENEQLKKKLVLANQENEQLKKLALTNQ